MKKTQNSSNIIEQYNTSIKDIGGVKDHINLFKAIEFFYQDEQLLEKFVIQENCFSIRTESGRKKVCWAIRKTILNQDMFPHRVLTENLFTDAIPYQDKRFYFLWILCMNNRLVRELTTRVFCPVYFSGRSAITKDDIIGYINEIMFSSSWGDQKKWSDETIYRCSIRYLGIMQNIGFLEPGKIKSFPHIRPTSEAQTLFLYFARIFSPNNKDILTNELLPTCFVLKNDIQDRLKKLSLKGFFDMSFNGLNLNIELAHDYKGVCDVLYS